MKFSHYFFLGIIGATSIKVALPQPLDKLDKGVLTEVPPQSATAPLSGLLEKASRPPKPEPKLPAEWENFTPTATQDPSTSFVGTLITKVEGRFTISSNPIFLVDKACKPPLTSDTKEDKVYTYAQKMEAGATIDLVVAKLHFGKDEAVQLTLSRIGGIIPTSGLDTQAIFERQRFLDAEHNKQKYWICTAQELFVTTYQKFHKDTAGGSGSYSVVKIDGTYFSQADELRKLYNFRLQLVPLESWTP